MGHLAEFKEEYKTVGMIPAGADDNYVDAKCENCGTCHEVICWEGYNIIVNLCDNCFAGIMA